MSETIQVPAGPVSVSLYALDEAGKPVLIRVWPYEPTLITRNVEIVTYEKWLAAGGVNED